MKNTFTQYIIAKNDDTEEFKYFTGNGWGPHPLNYTEKYNLEKALSALFKLKAERGVDATIIKLTTELTYINITVDESG